MVEICKNWFQDVTNFYLTINLRITFAMDKNIVEVVDDLVGVE